jgi:hypothetical protein
MSLSIGRASVSFARAALFSPWPAAIFFGLFVGLIRERCGGDVTLRAFERQDMEAVAWGFLQADQPGDLSALKALDRVGFVRDRFGFHLRQIERDH